MSKPLVDLDPIIFEEPRTVDWSANAWVGHIPFAFYIMSVHKPKLFVELGVHSGNSYNAFCQGADMLGLNTKCYGVDTWTGDDHAGHYDDSVYSKLAAYHKKLYDNFSQLLKMTFDEALQHFEDGSVDLLHIDGCHRYEEVRHDFESWFPKMSDRGIILFHDTEVRKGDFGVYKLWKELTPKYPHYNFTHSHGLGVLAVGKQASSVKHLTEHEGEIAQHFFSTSGERFSNRMLRFDLEDQLLKINQSKTDMENDLLAQLNEYRERDEQKEEEIKRLGEKLNSYDVSIEKLSGEILDLKLGLQATNEKLAEEERRTQDLQSALSQKESELADQDLLYSQMTKKHGELQDQYDSLLSRYNEKEEQEKNARANLAAKDVHIANLERDNQDLRKSISFRLGWWLTRPGALLTWSSLNLTISYWGLAKDIFLLALRYPRRFLRSLTPMNFRILRNALLNESSYEIRQNLHNKIAGRPSEIANANVINLLDKPIFDKESFLKSISDRDIPELAINPKVSIIILNRNGKNHLKRLAETFTKKTLYHNYELIFVDNDSTDDSVPFIEVNFSNSVIIKNDINRSFAVANNHAVTKSTGELLLFLNNDVIPMRGWLCHLLVAYEQLDKEGLGCLGATLLYPPADERSFQIQHRGIKFTWSRDFIRPINLGSGEYPDLSSREIDEVVANTGACLLISRKNFEDVGGFNEDYKYGYEDVDLGLKLGAIHLKNYCVSTSYLFHYEFGTQKQDTKSSLRDRRLNNISVLKKTWGDMIWESYWNSVIECNDSTFTNDELNIALLVTDSSSSSKAGDTFTALDFSASLDKLGYNISLFQRKGDNWNSIPAQFQIIISLLDSWDPLKASVESSSAIKVAWCRNWFEKWIDSRALKHFDLILTSSKKSIAPFRRRSGVPVFYFPLATNPQRFEKGMVVDRYRSDYCFTGSYWNDYREIIDFLDPSSLPDFEGAIFGHNWYGFKQFEKIYKGPLEYKEIKDVYASTKVLIDDANRTTKPWGSVNSRVYDALGMGVLVITNGMQGAMDQFDSLLPTYDSKQELSNQLNYFLSHPIKRFELSEKLSEVVRSNHTYDHRAQKFIEILRDFVSRPSLVIKVPSPKWETVNEWGDFHLAIGLRKAFCKNGWRARIQILPEWASTYDVDAKVVLVLRGLSKYAVKKHHINLMWNISHPEKISFSEYNSFDHIFVASYVHSRHLKGKLDTLVTPLLQCTSTDLFYPHEKPIESELLFVGNSRKVFRKIIKDVLPTKYDLSIYGTHWNGLVEQKYIKGTHIANNELARHYSGAKVVLNDHWESMRNHGFISNRIFDVLACGALLISDEVAGLSEIPELKVLTYSDSGELNKLIDSCLRKKIFETSLNRENVATIREMHTFDNRVETMLNTTTLAPLVGKLHENALINGKK